MLTIITQYTPQILVFFLLLTISNLYSSSSLSLFPYFWAWKTLIVEHTLIYRHHFSTDVHIFLNLIWCRSKKFTAECLRDAVLPCSLHLVLSRTVCWTHSLYWHPNCCTHARTAMQVKPGVTFTCNIHPEDKDALCSLLKHQNKKLCWAQTLVWG